MSGNPSSIPPPVTELTELREYLATLADKQADSRGDYLYRGAPDAALLDAIRKIDTIIAARSNQEATPNYDWRSAADYLLACIDMCNEAGAPPDELDPEDVCEIDVVRAALATPVQEATRTVGDAELRAEFDDGAGISYTIGKLRDELDELYRRKPDRNAPKVRPGALIETGASIIGRLQQIDHLQRYQIACLEHELERALNPRRHKYWGAGEPDCPREIKAGNGELHTLRCKVCGKDDPRDDRCLTSSPDTDDALSHTSSSGPEPRP